MLMKSKVTKIVFAVIMAMCVSNVSAQGFLDKISKGLDKVDDAMKKVDDVTGQLTSATAVDSTKKIQWDKIPEYHAEKIVIKDKDGNVVKNTDGTEDYRVMLIDQFGNIRSQEVADAQVKKLTSKILLIVGKVGGGALLGGLMGGGKGAAAGAVGGLLLSIDDIKMATKLNKSLKKQRKLIDEYKKSYTDEGKPVSASVDMKKIAGMEILDNNLSKDSEEILAIINSAEFKGEEGLEDIDSLMPTSDETGEKKS